MLQHYVNKTEIFLQSLSFMLESFHMALTVQLRRRHLLQIKTKNCSLNSNPIFDVVILCEEAYCYNEVPSLAGNDMFKLVPTKKRM
jgi:hypothetical protein